MVCKTCLANKFKNNKKQVALLTLSLVFAELGFYFSNQDPITANSLLAGLGAVAGGALQSSTATVNPDGLIVDYNETIGDYSSPTSASASSIDEDNTDNVLTMQQSSQDDSIAYTTANTNALGIKISNASSALVGNSYKGFAFAMSKTGSPTGNAVVRHQNSSHTVLATSAGVDVSTISTSEEMITFLFASPITISDGDEIVVYWADGDGSNYIRVFYDNDNNSYDGTLTQSIRYNGSWSVVTYDTKFGTINPNPNTVFDDDTDTKVQTDSEIGSYVQAGWSSQLVSHIAIHPHSNTDITEVKIQVYNGSSWVDARTILWSAFTEDDWNFVRINVTLCEEVRIINNDGTTQIVSIDEIKYLPITDQNLGRSHGHLDIDASDTALGLDGL